MKWAFYAYKKAHFLMINGPFVPTGPYSETSCVNSFYLKKNCCVLLWIEII